MPLRGMRQTMGVDANVQRNTEQELLHEREGRAKGPVLLDIPEVARDKSGIPMYVFRGQLKDSDRPTREEKTLEVILLWREAVMNVGHYGEPRAIVVGEAPDNDFRVAAEGLPNEHFRLLDVVDGAFAVNWTDAMAVEVRTEEGFIHDEDDLFDRGIVRTRWDRDLHGASRACHRYEINLGDRVAVQIGELTFVVQYVSPIRFPSSGILANLDRDYGRLWALSFLLHALLVVALMTAPKKPTRLKEDWFSRPNRFAKLIFADDPPVAKRPGEAPALAQKKRATSHRRRESLSAKEKEGTQKTRVSAPATSPSDARLQRDRGVAMAAGILKALGDAPVTTSVLGRGGLGGGISDALGGLRSAPDADMGGAGGLGRRGLGVAGGGQSLGIGGLGGQAGAGGELGDVALAGSGKGGYEMVDPAAVTKGCLSQQVVLRVLRRAWAQAKYCYEKELTRNPDLSGKVTTRFVIGGDGVVQSVDIRDDTMGEPAVGQCLQRVVGRLRFPPCAGGGVAEVHYPWLFKPGGA